MKLVDNWKSGWKWYSTHLTVANGAIFVGWNQIPQDFKDHLPHGLYIYLAVFMVFFTLLGRAIDQEKRP